MIKPPESVAYLREYNMTFSDQVLAAVGEAGMRQNNKTFSELADMYDVADGPAIVRSPYDNRPLELLTFTQKAGKHRSDNDEKRIRMYHTPMGNNISPNVTVRAMRLFEADPGRPLVVVGNPSIPGSNGGTMSVNEAYGAVRHKMLRPTVTPLLSYMQQQGITGIDQLGYSYGADKAVTAAGTAPEFGITTRKAVLVEPASLAKQSLFALARRFGASAGPLREYIAASNSEMYSGVRSEENTLGTIAYAAGLLRISNIAVAKVMAGGGFIDRIIAAHNVNPGLKTTVAWGTASEMLSDTEAAAACTHLARMVGNGSIRSMRLKGMHHAGGDNIDLHAAIMLQGLRR